ncbi:MAG: stage 0 sporulation protein [Lachnospiraceae bacterium]|nr:stage 0 sporulation protein [Lachnospiraceae bacterium]
MVKVIGVKFKTGSKVYYFDPGDIDIKADDCVIVETARGVEFGEVAFPAKEVDEDEITSPLKPVIRVATDADKKKVEDNAQKEKDAFDVCNEKIAKHGLEMKLVNVEYTFDGSKILFYFTADGRIDFRELVKDLASVYRTRIELRQIGVRDETRAMGGIGVCGREFCCHKFLTDFQPVSIRMAKDQNLSLNPTKIYGACGRLMCCIRYEEETYRELNKTLPRVGYETVTEDGYHGVVSAVNILRQKIKVIVDIGNDEREMREYDAGMLKFTKKNKGGEKKQPPTKEELQIIEDMKKDLR